MLASVTQVSRDVFLISGMVMYIACWKSDAPSMVAAS